MNELKRYSCPVEVTVEVIGGKWKCTILWWLRRSSKRFGELMQLIPRVTAKVLTKQLRELERNGLIERQTYRQTPPRVEYSLTSLGETLIPITELMCDWGKAQMPEYNFGLRDLEGLSILVAAEPDLAEQLRVELGTIRGAQVNTVSVVAIVESLSQIQLDVDIIVIDLENLAEALISSLVRQIQLLSTESSSTIPAIALAAAATRTQAFAAGFRLVLDRPVEPAELVAAIASVTGKLD